MLRNGKSPARLRALLAACRGRQGQGRGGVPLWPPPPACTFTPAALASPQWTGLARRSNGGSWPSGPVSDIYTRQIAEGSVQEDARQRAALSHLDRLHQALADGSIRVTVPPIPTYTPPKPEPAPEAAGSGGGFFSSLFGGSSGEEQKDGGMPAIHHHYHPSKAPKLGNDALIPTPTARNQGVYLHGGVGCGKSFLMDLFYDNAPTTQKRRVHFHRFMLDVHARLHELRVSGVPGYIGMPTVIREVAQEVSLLCFDEFTVSDVADAMILKGLFRGFFSAGMAVVATSNRPPDDLYQDGLNRQLFLPFIDLLKQQCTIHDMESTTDYRRSLNLPETDFGDLAKVKAEPRQRYFHPITPTTRELFERKWGGTLSTHGGGELGEPLSLPVFPDRHIVLNRVSRDRNAARLTAKEAIQSARSAADYNVLAKNFDTIFLEDIPVMTEHQITTLTRFILLIDELYEHKVKVVILAQSEPLELFDKSVVVDGLDRDMADILGGHDTGGASKVRHLGLFNNEEQRFAWDRVISRLSEMQSAEYKALPHIKGKNKLF